MSNTLVRFFGAIARRGKNGLNAAYRGVLDANYSTTSYSQFGEDMLLRAIFARFPKTYRGFYVDVGAHHPKRFSNTYHFYLRGWSGLCIDPIPGGKALFARLRPRDTFLEIGVSETEATMPYYLFKEPALNTFSEEAVQNCAEKPVSIRQIQTLPLSAIFAQHLPAGQAIDILSIDAEGFDLKILASNRWETHRPKVVVVEETSRKSLADVADLEMSRLLKQQHYEPLCVFPSGIIFVDGKSPAFDGGGFLNAAH